MGWSCSQRAGFTLEAIQETCHEQTGATNTFVHKERVFFFEVGRENPDGAITGSIVEVEGGTRTWQGNKLSIAGGSCRRRGSGFRISANGVVVRGPAWMKKVPVFVMTVTEPGLGTYDALWSPKWGEPTDWSLFDKLKEGAETYKPGGVNEKAGKSLGYIPYPTEAKVVRPNGEVVVEWKAGAFQVW